MAQVFFKHSYVQKFPHGNAKFKQLGHLNAAASSQCGSAVPTASVASAAGAAGSGSFYWYDAASAGNLIQLPPVSSTWSTFYSADFTSGVATGASIFGSANTTNVAGWLELTAAANSLNGAISVDAGVDAPAYKVEFDVYPNPVANELHIRPEKTPQTLQITNLVGKVQKQGDYAPVVTVSDLASGVYHIQLIYPDRHVESRKFIKY